MLQQQGTRILVTIFVVAIVVWVVLSVVSLKSVARDSEAPAPDRFADIVLRHRYADGMHEYRGTISLPTPCHRLAVVARVSADRSAVLIDLASKEEDALCIQIIEDRRFYVLIAAKEDATLAVALNGAPVAAKISPSQ